MGVRYDLKSKQILEWVMDNPGRGVPYTTRSLGKAIGRHHSLIGHLLTGERRNCDVGDAHAIARAVGVGVLVLFAPPASPETNETDLRQTAPNRRGNPAPHVEEPQ